MNKGIQLLLAGLCSLSLTACLNDANAAKKTADVVFKVHEDWRDNSQEYYEYSQQFCANPNPESDQSLARAQQQFAVILARLEGFDLLYSRQQLMPLRLDVPLAELSQRIDLYVAELENEPNLNPRLFDPGLNSVNSLEYLTRNPDLPLSDNPLHCQALVNILREHRSQAALHSNQVLNQVQRDLQSMVNRDSSEYYGLLLDMMRLQLNTSIRWATAPFDEHGDFHLERSIAPFSTNTVFHLAQPMETARILYVIGGPSQKVTSQGQRALTREFETLWDNTFGELISFGDYRQLQEDAQKREQMLGIIANLEAIERQLSRPPLRSLIESND